MNYNNLYRQLISKSLRITLPFIIYVFLNEIFFHIALIISERRLVAYPWINVYACGDPIGFDAKKIVNFIIFLFCRLLFIYLANKVFMQKYPSINFTFWIGSYIMMDFLIVVLSFLLPSILWETYFSSANPVLGLKKMWGPPIWLYFIGTGSICFLVYHFFFRQKLRDYSKIFINNTVSFALVFGIYCLYFGRIFFQR